MNQSHIVKVKLTVAGKTTPERCIALQLWHATVSTSAGEGKCVKRLPQLYNNMASKMYFLYQIKR